MLNWQPIQLPLESYAARSPASSSQRLLNLYAEQNPEGSPSPVSLYPTPGLAPWATVGDGPIRGLRVMGDYLWVVSGEELYRVDWQGTATLVGVIAGAAPCFMDDDGTHVLIAADQVLYAVNASGITVLSIEGVNGVAVKDGYGIVTQRGSQFFYLTALDDLTTIDPLDFSSADALPDNLIGCIFDHNELWLFKERSTEIWYNAGAASFPFVRAAGGFIERGCAASGSIAKANHRVFWLGEDLRVYASAGYQPQPISTHAIDALIREQSDPSSAEAIAYTQDGHTFYVLSFPTSTLVYNATVGRWHERVTVDEDRWRARSYALFNAEHLVGDFETGSLYELDLDTYTDDGDPIDRVVTFPAVYAGGKRIACAGFRLDAEAGVGLSGTDWTSDPQAFLDWSDDGGNTWSTPRAADMGLLGEYGARIEWTRLGTFTKRIFRVRINTPCRVVINGASASYEVLQ